VNEPLLEELYRRVFGYQLRLAAGNRTEAEERTQETMFRVLRSQEALRDPDRLVFWALRIATNVRIDAYRRHPPLVLEGEVQDSRPPPDPDLREETAEALARLAALPDSYRVAITLRYFEDLSYEDMATILGMPVGTVKSNVARGLRLIRRQLEKTHDELQGRE
jgi:RNA polymerase sigma-70 factor (ECF subfamily)